MKRILVTGGLQGIGAAIVLKLATRSNCEVYILDKDPNESFESKHEFLEFENIFYKQCDIGNPSNVKRVFEFFSSESIVLDSLINNAAIKGKRNFENEDILEWNNLLNVNLNGAYDVSRNFFLQVDRAETSRVVNIGSVNSKLISDSSASYHVSKAALVALTKYLSVHAPRLGIPLSINCLEPGFIIKNSDLESYMIPSNNEFRQLVEGYHPNSRHGSETDISKVCDWLIFEAPEILLSGQVIALDGAATNQEQSWLLRLINK